MICFNLLVLHSMFLFVLGFFYRWGTVTSNALMSFFKCRFMIKKVTYMNIRTKISSKSVHAGLALFNAVIFYTVFIFLQSTFTMAFYCFLFKYIFFFKLTWSLWNTPPPTKQTPPPASFFTLTLHSDVYNTSLVWRRVCLSNSGRQLGRWIVHIIVKCTSGSAASNTHVAAVEKKECTCQTVFMFVSLDFIEICVSSVFQGKIKMD